MRISRISLHLAHVLVVGLALFPIANCGSSSNAPGAGNGNGNTNGNGPGGGNGPGSGADGGSDLPVVIDPSQPPPAEPGSVEPNPTSPPDDSGHPISWPTGTLMDGVQVASNRDSAVVYVPEVAGVKDYRVMLLPDGISVSGDGTGAETVNGTTWFCAGYRQHAAPKGPREVLRQIEVVGLTGPTRVVVEAIDQPCPFPGIRGQHHSDLGPPEQEVPDADRVTFGIYTEQEIVQKYGNLIVNGQGPGATLASQADLVPPHVLARTTIKITPTGNTGPAPATTFFDDFSEMDQPKFVGVSPNGDRAQNPKHYQNAKWDFYTYGYSDSQIYMDRQLLRFVIGDWAQDVMGSSIAIARRPAQLSDTDYLHVTYEVQNDGTLRRYWWFAMCGNDQPGKTFDAQNNFLGNLVQTPNFMADDGLNPSIEGWNCIQLFARDGWPYAMPPDMSAPQTEVHVTLNKAGDLGRDNVTNPDPTFMPSNQGPVSWYRTLDKSGNANGKMLDDQQLIAPRTRFDLYIRRGRVVMFANGQQKLCNDFANHPLTMAEGAVGVGQVLYHTTAERMELHADYWDRTGQLYINENSPYLDVRTYDNVGYTEHAAPPENFDESVCYKFAN